MRDCCWRTALVAPDASTPLCWAVVEQNEKLVALLLRYGDDPNVVGITTEALPIPKARITSLYATSMYANLDIVENLLIAGADPQWRGYGGHTSLHEAARVGDMLTDLRLLVVGIDKSMIENDGTVTADWADRMGSIFFLVLSDIPVVCLQKRFSCWVSSWLSDWACRPFTWTISSTNGVIKDYNVSA